MILTGFPGIPFSPVEPDGPGIPCKIIYCRSTTAKEKFKTESDVSLLTRKPRGPTGPLSPNLPCVQTVCK